MAKFIQSKCGSFVNLNNVVSISYNQEKQSNYNEARGEWVATMIDGRSYLMIGFCCKKEELDSMRNATEQTINKILAL